jgi:uncharacterized DUF497 family protein
MRKIEIEWDEESIEHIGAHDVEPEEVEEVVQGRYFFQKGARGTHYAYGQSDSGRYLFVVLRKKPLGRFRVVTARDMNGAERKRFSKQMR